VANNYIALRASPDWLSFDVETSRAFCQRAGIEESTIIDFVAIWDRVLRVDYRQFRHRLKQITLANFKAVAKASVVPHQALRDTVLAPDDIIAFGDDDDWYSPELFSTPANGHGSKWASIRLGRGFDQTFDYDRASILSFRPVDRTIYTNTYMVTGQVLADIGYDSLFEHFHAQVPFDAGRFRPLELADYLSCANKTPASALSARFLLGRPSFLDDPRGEFSRFAMELRKTKAPAEAPWMAPPLAAFSVLIDEAVGG
jgi:hypothetical protein